MMSQANTATSSADDKSARRLAAERKVARLKRKHQKWKKKQRDEQERLINERTFLWNTKYLPNWGQYKDSKEVRALCLQGIPPSVRETVWPMMIENNANITPMFYDSMVERASKYNLEDDVIQRDVESFRRSVSYGESYQTAMGSYMAEALVSSLAGTPTGDSMMRRLSEEASIGARNMGSYYNHHEMLDGATMTDFADSIRQLSTAVNEMSGNPVQCLRSHDDFELGRKTSIAAGMSRESTSNDVRSSCTDLTGAGLMDTPYRAARQRSASANHIGRTDGLLVSNSSPNVLQHFNDMDSKRGSHSTTDSNDMISSAHNDPQMVHNDLDMGLDIDAASAYPANTPSNEDMAPKGGPSDGGGADEMEGSRRSFVINFAGIRTCTVIDDYFDCRDKYQKQVREQDKSDGGKASKGILKHISQGSFPGSRCTSPALPPTPSISPRLQFSHIYDEFEDSSQPIQKDRNNVSLRGQRESIERSSGRKSFRRSLSKSSHTLDKTCTIGLIDRDIPRTFPTLAFFHDGGPTHMALIRVLKSFVCYRKEVGYVQGMSFLGSMLLLYLPEYEAFQCLANLLARRHLLNFYTLQKQAIDGHVRCFDYFFKQFLPLLYMHFKREGVTSDMYLLDWTLSLFAKALPLEITARLWDCYLLQGEVFVTIAALGLLKLYAKQLSCLDMVGIMAILINFPRDIDGDKLMQSIDMIRIPTALHDAVKKKTQDMAQKYNMHASDTVALNAMDKFYLHMGPVSSLAYNAVFGKSQQEPATLPLPSNPPNSPALPDMLHQTGRSDAHRVNGPLGVHGTKGAPTESAFNYGYKKNNLNCEELVHNSEFVDTYAKNQNDCAGSNAGNRHLGNYSSEETTQKSSLSSGGSNNSDVNHHENHDYNSANGTYPSGRKCKFNDELMDISADVRSGNTNNWHSGTAPSGHMQNQKERPRASKSRKACTLS